MAEWLDIWGSADEVIAGGPAIFATQRGTGDIWHYVDLNDWKKIGGPGDMFVVSFSYEEGRFVPVLFGLSTDKQSVNQFGGTPMEWEQVGGPADRIWGGGPYLCATEPGTGNLRQYTGVPGQWTRIGGPGSMFAQSRHGLFGLSTDKQTVSYYTGTPHAMGTGRWTGRSNRR